MDDATIHERIEQLVTEEHELWQREAAGDTDDATRQRLAELQVSPRPDLGPAPPARGAPSRQHGSGRRGRARPERRRELPAVGPQPVILDNGVIRTLDPSLPTCGALAIAGPIVAGGVGTHEWMLPTPERVDLAGRCVLPAFTDSHVHFPTWSLARHDVRLEEADSVAAALALVAGHARRGTWIRGTGWRDAPGARAWPDGPTAAALDAVTGDTPAALWSKDYHSLWLNTAGLARAGGDLDEPGGVVERDADGSPTGILREESAWRFRDRFVTVTEDEWVDATREGIRVANARGVAAIHDKDGWLGAASIFGRIHEQEGLSLRVWQSLPADRLPEIAALPLRSRIGDDFLRLGYVKTFMDGTLGSQTALMLDGSGVQITSREELEEIIRAAAAVGWPVAVHAIGDRANRERARRVRGDAGRVEAARPPAPDRARAVPRPRRPAPVRRARRRLLGAVLARPVRPRSRRALLGRPARGHLRVPQPARLRRGRRQRLRRTGRGARPARRDPRRRPAHDRRPPRLAARPRR